MNYKRLLELFWEFSAEIETLHTLYLDSISGYLILNERLLVEQDEVRTILGKHEFASEEFQDTCSMSYKELCGKDFHPVSMTPVMKQGDIKSRTKENGKNYLLLGSQCVVAAYTYWEEYLRIEIGKAMNVLPADATNTPETRKILNLHVTSDFWGDMRLLRNSIVHSRGKGHSDLSKCKVLTWFKPGDEIELDYQKMRRIFLAMADYRNDVHQKSLKPSEGISLRRI